MLLPNHARFFFEMSLAGLDQHLADGVHQGHLIELLDGVGLLRDRDVVVALMPKLDNARQQVLGTRCLTDCKPRTKAIIVANLKELLNFDVLSTFNEGQLLQGTEGLLKRLTGINGDRDKLFRLANHLGHAEVKQLMIATANTAGPTIDFDHLSGLATQARRLLNTEPTFRSWATDQESTIDSPASL